ncbi:MULTISPECIES: hypothetical protein [unclassified Agarivorans]|uniref:hypothetical protein n=1 Tax=unclassified Agarivorans TaxID=2636026 RepID=UPI003D7F0F77
MNIGRLTEQLQLDNEQVEQFAHLEQLYDRLMEELFSFDGDRKQMWKAMRNLVKQKDIEIQKLLDAKQTQNYFTLKQKEKQQLKQALHPKS